MSSGKYSRKRNKETENLTWQQSVLLYLHDLIWMLAVLMIVFLLLFRMVVVSGPSMYSTLWDGDWLLVLSNVFYQNPEPAFMPAHDIVFPLTANGTCKIVGFYVTNTAEVAEYVKENFEVGDNITLKATGYSGATNKGTVEMKLVDFTEKKDSIVSAWTPFELSSLGYIEFVDLEITSTKPNTPAYFCMDMVVYSVELQY